MKFSITITDATPEEISAVLAAATEPRAYVTGGVLPPAPPAAVPDAPEATIPTDSDDGPANDQAPDVDARGIPWDERIHAKTKAVNKDGTWRYKRNTPEETIKAVEAEIGAPAPSPAAAAPAVPLPFPTATPAPATPPAHPAPPAAGGVPPMPAFLQQPTPAAPAEPVTYAKVIEKLTACHQAGKIDQHSLPRFWTDIGVDPHQGAVALQNDPAKLEAAFAKASSLLAA